MSLESAVQKLRDEGAVAVAVVTLDGTVLAADLPPSVAKETFSIMCATIHGAGMTVSNEMRRSNPRRIILDSVEGTIAIMEAGRRSLVVVALPPGSNFDHAPWLTSLLEQVARETG